MDKSLEYYNENAEKFIGETISVNFLEVQEKFLSLLNAKPENCKILDLGCGSGRDTKCFHDKGYQVVAVDGSEKMARQAGLYTGLPVECMDFRNLEASLEYDGIWACASFLHLSMTELPQVIMQCQKALKEGGIFYLSFKYGDYEGMREGRYYTDMNEERFARLLEQVQGLIVLNMWKSEDVREDREGLQWLNVTLRNED